MILPTNEQLKRALAKMNQSVYWSISFKCLCRFSTHLELPDEQVKDTELLQIVWEIEETLDKREIEYGLWCIKLSDICKQTNSDPVHATWQQRTIALAAVKNIEIV